MTNNDELALKSRIEKAIGDFTNGRAYMHVPAQPTDVDMVLSDCLALLAERDADKKRIEMLEKYVNERDAQNQDLLLNIGSLQQRIAELEARTVSVKLPEPATEGGRGYRQKVIWVLKEALFDAGINLEVEE